MSKTLTGIGGMSYGCVWFGFYFYYCKECSRINEAINEVNDDEGELRITIPKIEYNSIISVIKCL